MDTRPEDQAHPSPESTTPRPPKRRRAWWQWVLGLGLIIWGTTSLVYKRVTSDPEIANWLIVNYPGLLSTIAAEPIPLRVPESLVESPVVPAQPGDFVGHNLLLITLDTTRADRLGCYGNDKIKTPTMDRLARNGVLFSRAISPQPTTLPSHATMLTGLYPYHHGARANGVFRLSEENVTMAEILLERGYQTGAAISAFVLDSSFGTNQGFEYYDDEAPMTPKGMLPRNPERRGGDTTDRAIDWLGKIHHEEDEKPFFFWIHYFDPHQPYEPIDPWEEEYKDFLYDGEIAYVDHQIDRLLTKMDELGVLDKTLIVVVGDHGQGLGQNGELTHGVMLYDTTLHVPFIMACGDRLGGGVHIPGEVCLVDMMPTLLSLLGIPIPERCDGYDLTQPLPEGRLIFMDTLEGYNQYSFAPLLAVRDGRMKYIHGPEPELFDLIKDPYEQTNLYASQPDVARSMEKLLQDFYEKDLRDAAYATPTEQLSDEDLAKLRSLGYLGEAPLVMPSTPLPDPKQLVQLTSVVESSFAIAEAYGLDSAIKNLQRVISRYPDFYSAHRHLGGFYVKQNRLTEAAETYRRCMEINPGIVQPILELARLSAYFGDVDEAIDLYQHILKIAPDHFAALVFLGEIRLAQNDYTAAADLFLKAMMIRPADEIIAERMAYAMNHDGRGEEAVEILRERLERNPRLAAVRNALGSLLRRYGTCDQVVELMREGVRLDPDKDQLVNNLALTITACMKPQESLSAEAILMMEQLCRKTQYQVPEYLRTLSMLYFNAERLDEALAVGERALDLARGEGKMLLVEAIEANLAEQRETGRKTGRRRPVPFVPEVPATQSDDSDASSEAAPPSTPVSANEP